MDGEVLLRPGVPQRVLEQLARQLARHRTLTLQHLNIQQVRSLAGKTQNTVTVTVYVILVYLNVFSSSLPGSWHDIVLSHSNTSTYSRYGACQGKNTKYSYSYSYSLCHFSVSQRVLQQLARQLARHRTLTLQHLNIQQVQSLSGENTKYCYSYSYSYSLCHFSVLILLFTYKSFYGHHFSVVIFRVFILV